MEGEGAITAGSDGHLGCWVGGIADRYLPATPRGVLRSQQPSHTVGR